MHLHGFLHAIGRHTGRHGSGGRGFGRGFMGDGGMPAGRKLTAADLQLLLLALLDERPAHGYELIRLLEERSAGFYAPSPGMIYPALTYLEEIGHAAVSQEGNRKLYALTNSGRAQLETNRAQAMQILEALKRVGERMAGVREAYAGLDAADPQAADEMHRAKHALKHLLMSKHGCAPEEARRIALILDRAAAEISGTQN